MNRNTFYEYMLENDFQKESLNYQNIRFTKKIHDNKLTCRIDYYPMNNNMSIMIYDIHSNVYAKANENIKLKHLNVDLLDVYLNCYKLMSSGIDIDKYFGKSTVEQTWTDKYNAYNKITSKYEMELRTPFENDYSNCFLTVKLDGYRHVIKTHHITKMMHFIKYFKEKYFDKDKTKVKIVKQKTEVKKEELTVQMINDCLTQIFTQPTVRGRLYNASGSWPLYDYSNPISRGFSVRYGYNPCTETPVTEPTVVQFSEPPPPDIQYHTFDDGSTVSYIANPIIDD